eukprot:159655_1
MGKHCCCNCRCCKYIKILVLGICSFSSVFAIYTMLGRINKIDVDKYNTNIVNGDIDGIQCYPSITATKTYDDATKYCDNIITDMAKSVDDHPEWNCSSYTDYAEINLYDELSYLANLIYSIFVFSFISNVAAISHDCALIYQRKNLKKIKMFFEDEFAEFQNTNWIILCSSTLIGLCRFGIIICSGTLTFFAYEGISKSIFSPTDECHCRCWLILQEADFWSYLSASYVVLIV